jgi:transcriptional regulator of acetoin/glycerol metabolism
MSTGAADEREIEAAGVDSALLESWRRCLRYGLDSSPKRVVRVGDVDANSPLVRLTDSVVSTREAVLEQSMSGLSLTDADGLVLRQWVGDPALGRWFDQHDIVPSVSVDESAVGTTSGICLLNEHPTMVRGLEHFYEDYREVTSAGVPVVHPVTRRVVGSLNLTSRYSDTSPVLLAWVMDLVRDIQNAFLEVATRRERTLLNAYLTENRDARHPLVALNDQTIITNATAARLLTSVDQALLWEQASRAIRENVHDPRQMVLTDGTVVSVQCREIVDSSESAGAVVRIRPVVNQAPSRHAAVPVAALAGLVGDGPQWRDLCRRAAAAGQDKHILIVGERGTGKTAVAQAMAGDGVTVLDASTCADKGLHAWLVELAQVLESTTESAVIIRRSDELTESAAEAVAGLIRSHRRGPHRVFATAAESADHGQASPLQAEFPVVLTVPALRDRIEDLPVLLDALTRIVGDRLGRNRTPVRWMPDAVQALSRLDWNGNVAALETVVLRVLQATTNGYVNAADLPTDVVASASRRKLVGLEHVEAKAITAALREARGNKHRAAESLGIARSTLYRKIRTLGIDLSTAAF